MVNTPPAYGVPAEQAIVSVDITDLSQRTGTVVFFGAQSNIEGTPDYHLFRTVIESNDIQLVNSDISNATLTKVWDLDFDLTQFQLPQDIEGTAYISVPVRSDVGSGTCDSYIIARIRKWDGTSETDIASARSETVGAFTLVKKLLIPITVPFHHFQQGETLRVTIEFWHIGESPGNPNEIAIAFDSKGRTTTQFPGTGDFKVTTVLEVHIPFRLNF